MPKTPTEQAEFDLAKRMAAEMQDNCGVIPEACDAINNRSRKLIAAVKEQHGDCWLFKTESNKDGPQIWQWDDGLVYNFGADGALPCSDQKLVELIDGLIAIKVSPNWQDEWMKQFTMIKERVKELQGHWLVWT